MDANGEVLGELIKAKENIKRKYSELKHGKAVIHSLFNLLRFHLLRKQMIIKILKLPTGLKSYDIDKTYGPKINTNGNMYLGKKEIKLVDNTLTIEDSSYPITPGLGNLIFLKSPKLYTNKDLKTYKSILNQTSAHLKADGGNKYADIIQNLFPSGSGLTVKLQKHNLVYWNDPNELVDRLRLLLASKAVGNTGVSNEILSIFEELREAGVIKPIELHKPARKNYIRRRINLYGKNGVWQADLVEMIPYSKKNKGYKYILCVIDCFTKFAWAISLKSKTAKEVSTAMSKILLKSSPKILQLDNGKEFYNSTFDALMEKHNIHKYSTY
ncbi:Uncharacterized protein FWK35_00031703, partial [Aphis craccivora]